MQPWPEWAQRGGHPQQAPQAQPPGHSQPPAQFTASQIPSSYQPQPGGASHPAQPEPTVPWAQVQQTDSGPVHHTGTVLPAGQRIQQAQPTASTRAESLAREQLSREQRALQAADQATQEVPRLPGYATAGAVSGTDAADRRGPGPTGPAQTQQPSGQYGQGQFGQQSGSAQPQHNQSAPPYQQAPQQPWQQPTGPQAPPAQHSGAGFPPAAAPAGAGAYPAVPSSRQSATAVSYAAPASAVSYAAPQAAASYAPPASAVSYAPPASSVSYAVPAAPGGYGAAALNDYRAPGAGFPAPGLQPAAAPRSAASWTEAPPAVRPQPGYEQPIAEYQGSARDAAPRVLQGGYAQPTGPVPPLAPAFSASAPGRAQALSPQQVSPEAREQVWSAPQARADARAGQPLEPVPLIPPPPLETVSNSPAGSYQSGEVPPVREHWSAEADHLTREAAPVSPGTGQSTSAPSAGHALIVTGSENMLTGPLTSTGEILLTGSMNLPRRFASTGALENIDGLDADQHEQHDETHETSPVRALRAVGSSHHTARSGGLMTPSKLTTSLPTVLAVGGTILAVLTVGMVIGVFWLGLF